jgi:SH3-like domain-containing protein
MDLGQLRRVIDMGGSKKWLWNALIRGSRSDGLLRLEDERFHDDHVSAATEAIVT